MERLCIKTNHRTNSKGECVSCKIDNWKGSMLAAREGLLKQCDEFVDRIAETYVRKYEKVGRL